MSEVAIDLEAERRASIERRNAQMRRTRARSVRQAAAEHGGIDEAAQALYGHLGEAEVARIAALAASDEPLDDGSRRLSPEEIETLMATRQKTLAPEDVKRMHEYVAAARQADPEAKAREVYERAKEDLGLEVSFTNFQITYWYAYKRRAKKLPKKTVAPPRTPPAPRLTPAAKRRPPSEPAAESTAAPQKQAEPRTRRRSYARAIEMLSKELREATERAERLRAAIEALEEIDAA